jgi:hypothetical protein
MVGEIPDERRSRPLSNNLRDDRLPRAEYLDLAVWHGFKVDFKVGFKVILVSETCSPQGGLRRMDTLAGDFGNFAGDTPSRINRLAANCVTGAKVWAAWLVRRGGFGL